MSRARDIADLGSNPPLDQYLGGPSVSIGTVTSVATSEISNTLITQHQYSDWSINSTRFYIWDFANNAIPQSVLDWANGFGIGDSFTIQVSGTFYTFTLSQAPYAQTWAVQFEGSWENDSYPTLVSPVDISASILTTNVVVSNPDGNPIPATVVQINGNPYSVIEVVGNTLTLDGLGATSEAVGSDVYYYGSPVELTGTNPDGSSSTSSLGFNSASGFWEVGNLPIMSIERIPLVSSNSYWFSTSLTFYSPEYPVTRSSNGTGRGLISIQYWAEFMIGDTINFLAPRVIPQVSYESGNWIDVTNFDNAGWQQANTAIFKGARRYGTDHFWVEDIPDGDFLIRFQVSGYYGTGSSFSSINMYFQTRQADFYQF